MNDFSALNKGDEGRWRDKLEEGIEDKEVFLATFARWTYQKRCKMKNQLKIYKKAIRILDGE